MPTQEQQQIWFIVCSCSKTESHKILRGDWPPDLLNLGLVTQAAIC